MIRSLSLVIVVVVIAGFTTWLIAGPGACAITIVGALAAATVASEDAG